MDSKKIMLVFFVSFVFFAQFSCDENVCSDCNPVGYSFQDSVLIKPNTETIDQGDTLWLSCEIQKKQKDLISGNIVSYPTAKNISLVFKIQKLLSKNSSEYSLNNFDILIEQGTKVKHFLPEGALEVLFGNTADSYLYKVGLVPQKNIAKGIYFLFYSQIGGVYDDKQRAASYNIGLKCKNQHLNLYYDNITNAPIAPQFEKTVYCFGVAE